MEQRRTLRYQMELPLRIVELDGQRVNWAGQTRDISLGGVSFRVQNELVPGTAVVYMITLSSISPPVHIGCVGKVLRCRNTDSGCLEAAIGMERYTFLRQEELELFAVSAPDGTDAFKKLRRPALSRSGTA